MIALLGRRDIPTDGVEEYCKHLSEALEKNGYELKLVRVPWAELGWIGALRWLWRQSSDQTGQWTLVQYTALSWSRHGFSLGFLAVLWVLRKRRARLAVVFHDAEPYRGTRAVDRIRRACQLWVMRTSYRWALRSIVTVPIEGIPFLPQNPTKAAVVPVGANIPEASGNGDRKTGRTKTVAVFGVTGGGTVGREIADIAYCMDQVSRRFGRPHLVLMGRDSSEAEGRLRQALNGAPVDIEALGLLPPEDVSRTLQTSDALLFVRGPISTKKGSAIAGIACGLPVVGYAGPQTGPPLTDAGVMLAPEGDQQKLSEALIRVLSDEQLWQELHRRSLCAQEQNFSWSAIAERLMSVLNDE
jgi:glycosyltransferase involved in cell wall biosynthesis